VLVTQLPTKDQ